MPIGYAFATSVMPRSNDFDENQVGIVIGKFSGASLAEFGNEGLQETLRYNLSLELKRLHLGSKASFITIPWKVTSLKEAIEQRELYNARGIIWGKKTKLVNGASIGYENHWKTVLSVISEYRGGERRDRGYKIFVSRMGPRVIEFTTEGYTLENLINPVLSDVLPFILQSSEIPASLISEETIEIVDRNAGPHSPPLLFYYGQKMQSENKFVEAIRRYKDTFEICCSLKVDKNLGISDNKVFSDYLVDFASSAKLFEAMALVKVGDTISAISAYLTACKLNPSYDSTCAKRIRALRSNGISDFQIREVVLPDCFAEYK